MLTTNDNKIKPPASRKKNRIRIETFEEVSSKSKTKKWFSFFIIIPKEVIGKISTFLDISSVSNLIQVTNEKQDREFIKISYLRYNFVFLRLYIKNGVTVNKLQQRIYTWMNVNKDWKEIYDYYNNPNDNDQAQQQHDGIIISKQDQDDFNQLFNNIIFHITYSILDVVKHLVTYRNVDINKILEYTQKDTGNKVYRSPLQVATVLSKISVLECILSRKDLNVNKVVDVRNGFTTLHYMMIPQHNTTIDTKDNLHLLLSHLQTNINVQTIHGCTPLHVTCIELHSSSIWKTKMLIEEFGANVHIRDMRGRTALDILQTKTSYSENLADVKETMISYLLSLQQPLVASADGAAGDDGRMTSRCNNDI